MTTVSSPSLAHVFWIGGSPCSGKSTIAAALAAEFDLARYTCDDEVERHASLASSDAAPVMRRLARATCDDLWMRPVGQQIREEIAHYEEEFPFILDDLHAMSGVRPVIAEGAALLPRLLTGIGIDPVRSIWIVPSPAFQRDHYARRMWRHDVLAPCADPDQAWRNWMDRDIGFARHVAAEARRQDLTCLTVDGSRSLRATVDEVRRHFGLSRTALDATEPPR